MWCWAAFLLNLTVDREYLFFRLLDRRENTTSPWSTISLFLDIFSPELVHRLFSNRDESLALCDASMVVDKVQKIADQLNVKRTTRFKRSKYFSRISHLPFMETRVSGHHFLTEYLDWHEINTECEDREAADWTAGHSLLFTVFICRSKLNARIRHKPNIFYLFYCWEDLIPFLLLWMFQKKHSQCVIFCIKQNVFLFCMFILKSSFQPAACQQGSTFPFSNQNTRRPCQINQQ